MKDYLLDTNIAGHYAEYKLGIKNAHTIAIDSHIKKINPERCISFCVITVGEMEYGLKVALNENHRKEINKLCEFVLQTNVFGINQDVAKDCYGDLRAKLFEKFSEKTKKKAHRMRQLADPVTEESLGIQENDLWIASVAMTFGLILVTDDKLRRIKEVVGSDLEVENWLIPKI